MMKDNLLGKSLEELQKLVVDLGMPKFTGKQLCEWLYVKKAVSFDQMTNISKKNRTILESHFNIGRYKPILKTTSVDGTEKYLFKIENDKFIETVYIPDRDRATLCVSSQIGCKMNCLFCMTGKQGFSGHLTSSEIMNQILSVDHSELLTNIVYMGMGEPLDNVDEVLKSTQILTAEWGLAWSPKRITVSTIGAMPGLKRFLDESDCHLAISIHSPLHEERGFLMPVEKAFPILNILDLLKQYDFQHQRRLSFEYIVFKDLNDSLEHADSLARLLKGLNCRVNLIRFHKIPGVDLRTTDEYAMEQFQNRLLKHGLKCTIRSSRGEDIQAACGMLSSKEGEKNINLPSC